MNTQSKVKKTCRRGFMQLLVWGMLLHRSNALGMSRRCAIVDSITASTNIIVGHGICGALVVVPNSCYAANEGNDRKRTAAPFLSYRVIPDASAKLNPTIQSIKSDILLDSLSRKSGAIWLGEHHNSAKDHTLQTEIIRRLHSRRKVGITNSKRKSRDMAIGLEQVQVKFQSVLDDFIAGKITLKQMKEGVEWENRWQWPFERYSSVFEAAKELEIPLLALNVNSEDLALVENGGLPNLSPALLDKYIPDRQGFADFAKPLQYRVYVDYVIRPSYDMHNAMGLLEYSMGGQKLDQRMTFRNFFSARILWDESMASRAYEWTKLHPGGLLVGLVGADHVKFRNGIPGRYSRFGAECISVLLNPSLIDTRPSGSVDMVENDSTAPDQFTLQLRYEKDGVDLGSDDRFLPSSTGGVMPLADYFLLS